MNDLSLACPHVPSFLQLQAETKLPQWQRWVGYSGAISDDTFGYVSERLDPEQLRRAARYIHRKLKRGKAFEANKIKGLLCVSLDANEQFCSDHRCCEQCLTREVTCKDASGQEVKKTQYYHKQIYAQLSGPELSVILDFEPMRPGEEECAAALRLLRRLRATHGPRFFDVVRRALTAVTHLDQPPPANFPPNVVIRFDVQPETEPVLQ